MKCDGGLILVVEVAVVNMLDTYGVLLGIDYGMQSVAALASGDYKAITHY